MLNHLAYTNGTVFGRCTWLLHSVRVRERWWLLFIHLWPFGVCARPATQSDSGTRWVDIDVTRCRRCFHMKNHPSCSRNLPGAIQAVKEWKRASVLFSSLVTDEYRGTRAKEGRGTFCGRKPKKSTGRSGIKCLFRNSKCGKSAAIRVENWKKKCNYHEIDGTGCGFSQSWLPLWKR